MSTQKELLFFPNLNQWLTEEQIYLAKLQWLAAMKECRAKPTPARCLAILDCLRKSRGASKATFSVQTEEQELARKELIKEFNDLLKTCRAGG